MQVDPELNQQLLELVYELLPAEEAAQLRQRITAEPEVAAAFAKAQRTAEMLNDAARVQAPAIPLFVPIDSTPVGYQEQAEHEPDSRRPGVHWCIAIAAALLLLVTGGGYLSDSASRDRLADQYVRLEMTGPAKLQPGVSNHFNITTTNVKGSPRATAVRLALQSPSGESLLAEERVTDKFGRLTLAIPASIQTPSGSNLLVFAKTDAPQQVQQQLEVAPARYLARLGLDKPLYLPGETIYYRSVTLNCGTMTADREWSLHFEIQDPSGAVVAGSELDGDTERGVGNGAFEIPPELAGGEYALVVRSADGGFPEERRTFFIRHFRLPRIKKELEFTRDSYGPGDPVVADFSAERTEGGALANAPLRIIATVDGQVVHQSAAQASASGAHQVSFDLPQEIATGAGQLAVIVDDGGTQETIAKTIPINLGKLDVKFYPEGGDLVAGLENRVYFVGRDLLGEPAHIEGRVVDRQKKTVANVKTEHEGMGAFRLTPVVGETYTLEIASPKQVSSRPELPAVNSEQMAVLSTGPGVFAAGKPVAVTVNSKREDAELVVAAYCRGTQVGQQSVSPMVGKHSVALDLPESIGGVVRLTVFDYSTGEAQPVAERLVYRRPSRELRVRVTGHGERYSPGESVDLTLAVTDEKGQPARDAVLGVSVVDDALLNLADDDTPRLPTHFLLTSEIENAADLEDADFYLSNDPKAGAALDLLLGTQGWRRFAPPTPDTVAAATALAAAPIEPQAAANQRAQQTLAELEAETAPPAMVNNSEVVQAEYTSRLATVADQRGARWATIGLVGGALLLLVVMALVVFHVAAEAKVWIPSIATAMACLALTWVWSNDWSAESQQLAQVASRSESRAAAASATAPTSAPEDKYQYALKEGLAADAPVLLGAEVDRGFALGLAPAPGEKVLLQKNHAELRDEFGVNRFAFGGGMGGGMAGGFAGPGFRFNEEADAVGMRGRLMRRGLEDAPALRQAKEQAAGKPFGDQRELEAIAKDTRMMIREYAHMHQPASQPGVRSDFTQTLYWHPLLLTDEAGHARVQFQLSDAVTTFRVQADAHGGGRIGGGEGEVISRIPFSLEPKLPLEVTAGDTIDLPVAVVNDTHRPLNVTLGFEIGDLLSIEGPTQRELTLEPEQRRREYVPMTVVGQSGEAKLRLHGIAGMLADAVEKPIRVVPPGFPITQSYAGQIDGPQELTINLPAEWVPGSLEVSLQAFPSTLADLQQGLDGMLRQPTGCFEQASTSNYPNVLTLQYLEEHRVSDPDLTRRARELLKTGYGLLSGYECPQKGYEWFGGDPGHEALTAYGLMEFNDMRQVHEVDSEMIERTRRWLLARRDGKGGFQRNSRALDSFGAAPAEITDAYIVWALTESGQTGLDAELRRVKELGTKSDDPYLISLAAAGLLNAGDSSGGKGLLDKLAKAQGADGHLDGKQGSITRSGGISLQVETTALAALAWLKLPEYRQQAQRAIDWLIKSRQGSGDFGSTQATILALKALVAHAAANRAPATGGDLIVRSGDAEISRQTFQAGQQHAISIDGLEGKLTAGENRVTISLSGDSKMPYVLDVSYRSSRPASDARSPIRLKTLLAGDRVRAGETVQLTSVVTNTSEQGQPMTIAILGLPAGLEARPEQLEDLKKAGTIDYYETRAREVHCYWRSLAPNREVEVKLDLVAEIPGRYTAPASRAYLYYTAEQKQWVEPVKVEITRE